MSKVLTATCAGGVVTSEGVQLPSGVTILSQGIGASEGALVIDEVRAFYLAKTSPDLDAALSQIISALNNAVTALSAVSTALPTIAGGTGDPGAIAAATAAVASIGVASASITTATGSLSTLKGQLK